MKFSVDSLPATWDKPLPTKEGIYYYQNDSLILFSNEQSADRFKANNKDGFYFIPNKGRLFDRININNLD